MNKGRILGTGIANIADLQNWEKNPRVILDEEIAATIVQLKELGQYGPLLVSEEGIVLGGNARLEALKRMKETKVWVTIVKADTMAEKMFWNVVDNDQVGSTNQQKLMPLVSLLGVSELNHYSVDFGYSKPVKEIMLRQGIEAPYGGEGGQSIQKYMILMGVEQYERVIDLFDQAIVKMGGAETLTHTEVVLKMIDDYENQD